MTTPYGVKYTCFKCGCKFYDLNKPEPICPKCQANQKDAPKVEPKGVSSKRASKVVEEYYGGLYDDEEYIYDTDQELDEELVGIEDEKYEDDE